jgi:hypothetical protein
MRRFSSLLGWVGLVVAASGLTVLFILHDPPDTKTHVARECRLIADLESKRMVRWEDFGPAPFEIWRAENRTSGAARPDLAPKANAPVPWKAALIERLSPRRDLPSIDCGKALDEQHVPLMMKYNSGPSQAISRYQYSRVTFLPGDRYALFRMSSCDLDPHGWDQHSRIMIWQRDRTEWEPVSGHITTLVYEPPRFKPPMRCFEKPAY